MELLYVTRIRNKMEGSNEEAVYNHFFIH